MKKRLLSIITATAMTLSAVPFVVSAESDTNTELWEKFLKYDLCITDFDSLTDEEKNLCRFIYDTELDYYKSESDFAICERARRILKHDTNIGERVTAEELEDCYGIYDKYRYGTGYLDYIQCVPDISYYNFETGSYTEYWFDESGDNKAVFSETDGEYVTYNITIIENGKTVKETETKIHPNLALKKYEYGYPKNEITITDDLIEYNDDYYYITSQNTAVLFKNKECNDSEKTHVIPEKVNGYPVTAIESKAFYCSEYKKVELPESLEFIGDSAFAFSQKLEEINFPSNLKLIGSGSFEYTKLKDIYVDCPDAVISSGAFADIWCELNAYVNAKEILRYAFYESGIQRITLGKNVERIGEYAFDQCDVSIIELSTGLKSIGQGAFSSGGFTYSVYIPKSVEVIGAVDSVYPFPYRFTSYQECVFKKGMKILGVAGSEAERYADEWGLEFETADVELPNDSDDEIIAQGKLGYSAYWTLDKEGKMVITGKNQAFLEYSGQIPYKELIKSVVIEEGITSIGRGIFSGCSNLETVYLPNGLTEIEDNAFVACKALKTIDIPSSVNSIGENAFCGCNSLEEIIIENPMCIIFNSNGTISNIQLLEDEYKYNGVIRGLKGSTAEIYAKTYGIEFAEIKTESIKGDANCDGNVNMADAVLIMQSLANPDKYGVDGSDETHITEQGIANGDMDGNGLTNADALEIQKKILKLS